MTVARFVALAVHLMIRLRRAHPSLVQIPIGNAGIWVTTPVVNSTTRHAICDVVFL